ncbi:MAG: hypothetical protein LBQ05_01715 [Christensenellaceae bacterium]|jgi:hypothetical protein|nr:hypothetical protein [Christensenellaceae bacterium]
MQTKTDKKDWVLISLAWVTFLLHISYMWYTGIQNGTGTGEASRSILFPLYSCNLSMYLLLALLFIPRGKLWDIIAVATAYAGVIGGIASITDYLMDPNWQSYEFMKSLLSHLTLTAGCVWLFIKYIKISVKNLLPCLYYIALCLIDALFLMWLLPGANPMWLRSPLVDDVSFLIGWNLGWLFMLSIGTFCLIWDLVKYKGKINLAFRSPHTPTAK